MLTRLNSHGTGYAGLLLGGGSIVASVAAFFRLLSSPTYLDALFAAVMHARAHALTAADVQTYAQLAGACVAIIGAIAVALLLTYFGRPLSVASDTPTGAAQASYQPHPSSPGKEP